MAIRLESIHPQPFRNKDDVTIVWKGSRIAKLVFPSGKVVQFDCDDTLKAPPPAEDTAGDSQKQ